MSTVTLTLMRHAKSSWQNPGQSDHDRPLNKRGHRDAPVMAARLMQREGIPSLILSSSARRTQETTAHLLDIFGNPSPEVRFDNALYLASASTMISLLSDIPDNYHHVLVVAHNPGMEELSAYLSGSDTDIMPTAALRQFSCSSFGGLSEDNRAHASLTYSDYPKNPSS